MKSTTSVQTVLHGLFAALLWLSTLPAEAGENIWTTHGPAGPVRFLATPPADSRTIYAGGQANFDVGPSLFKSVDGGESWEMLPLGNMPSTMLTCLAVDPVRPASVHAGLSSPSSPFRKEFLSSLDGGAHWKTQAIDDWPFSIAVDSKTGAIYVGGGETVLKSTDGGDTWSRLDLGGQHVGYALLADALEERLLVGSNFDFVDTPFGDYPSGGSVGRSVDGGSTWSFSTLSTAGLYSMVISLSKDARGTAYYAGTWDGALYRSADGGANWQPLATLPGTVSDLVVDPSNSSFVYAAIPNRGVLRSTDGGVTWWPFNSGMSSQYVTSLTIDPTGQVLHAATDQGVFDYQIVGLPGPSQCIADATALCVNGRFRVTASWRTADGSTGSGRASTLNANSGYFWFFDPANVEVVVKVLDGCSINGNHWVFAAGLTNIEVAIRVTDNSTGITREYTSQQGTPFAPVQDTVAFATCP